MRHEPLLIDNYYQNEASMGDYQPLTEGEANAFADRILAYWDEHGSRPVIENKKTLLDEFAMAALSGILAAQGRGSTPWSSHYIQSAYLTAHAMMDGKREEDKKRSGGGGNVSA